jgi:hypothetical protein
MLFICEAIYSLPQLPHIALIAMPTMLQAALNALRPMLNHLRAMLFVLQLLRNMLQAHLFASRLTHNEQTIINQ